MEKNQHKLDDKDLFHLVKETGYAPSSDFTDKIMQRVHPPKKTSFLPVSKQISWQQYAMMALPLMVAFGFALFAFFGRVNEGIQISILTETFGSLLGNQVFLISIAVAFSAAMYFTMNMVLQSRK